MNNGKRKRILRWNRFWNLPGWEFGDGHEPFRKWKCPVHNCELVDDRKYLNTSDAILFHNIELKANDKPAFRNPDQRWIFFAMESPVFQYWKPDYGPWKNLFNWTMTYRHDSDIRIQYGGFRARNKSKPLQPIKLAGRKNMAAWMVSNCQSPGQRMRFVRELDKYFWVDIFGRCGRNSCPKNKTVRDNFKQCFDKLAPNYKFYLANENSYCEGYASEKPFHPLRHGMVPITFGGLNYDTVLPRGSYIDFRDFKSPQKLAEYLADFILEVPGAEERYKEFFRWREDYEILGYYDAYPRSWCDLCRKLHEPHSGPRTYDDIVGWWGKKTCLHGDELMARLGVPPIGQTQ